ncbi:MAG: hypothetical protein QM644_10915 [Mobilitalea sp.]
MSSKKKSPHQKVIKSYTSLLYMTPISINTSDIASFFQDKPGITVQHWEEMNVLELELSNENFIDFEALDPSFKDPKDASFVKNRKIASIFAIDLAESDLEAFLPDLLALTEQFSGFVCADTPDFTPVYAGSSKKD